MSPLVTLAAVSIASTTSGGVVTKRTSGGWVCASAVRATTPVAIASGTNAAMVSAIFPIDTGNHLRPLQSVALIAMRCTAKTCTRRSHERHLAGGAAQDVVREHRMANWRQRTLERRRQPALDDVRHEGLIADLDRIEAAVLEQRVGLTLAV